MAWIRPKKWFGGEVPSATKLNEQLRDNFNAQSKDKPYFEGQITGSSLSLTNSTATNISWTANQDTAALQNVSLPARISCGTDSPGLYFVSASVRFAGNATGLRRIRLNRSDPTVGVTVEAAAITKATGGITATDLSVGCLLLLNSSQYFVVEVFQNSGGALALAGFPRLTVAYVGENEWAG
jgi:hypothetical protein